MSLTYLKLWFKIEKKRKERRRSFLPAKLNCQSKKVWSGRKRREKLEASHGNSTIRTHSDVNEIHIWREFVSTALGPSTEALWCAESKHTKRKYKWFHHQQLLYQQQQLSHPMPLSPHERRTEKYSRVCHRTRFHLTLQHHLLHKVHG